MARLIKRQELRERTIGQIFEAAKATELALKYLKSVAESPVARYPEDYNHAAKAAQMLLSVAKFVAK